MRREDARNSPPPASGRFQPAKDLMDKPAPFLVRHLGLLPKGRAVDVAMGKGRNAVFLAEQGWEVIGLERDPDAISAVRALASTRMVRIETREIDLERSPVPAEGFDLLICFFYLDRKLIPSIHEAVRPGGVVVYETFLLENHLRFGHPRRKEFCLAPEELKDLFSGFDPLIYEEGEQEGSWTTRLIARK